MYEFEKKKQKNRLLNEKYSQLTQTLTGAAQQLAQNGNKVNPATEEALNRRLNSISEDIHWLLLVTGFTLFEINAESSQSRIPNEIMAYSIRCSQFVNIELVADLIGRLGQLSPASATSGANKVNGLLNMISVRLVEACPLDTDPVDPLTVVFLNAFRLCELELYAKSASNAFSYLSPQVAETLVWFLRESVRAYIFMVEANYDQISPILHLVFAQDTPLGPVVLNFLLRKVLVNFNIWSAENTITSQSAKLLLGNAFFFSLNNKLLYERVKGYICHFKCTVQMGHYNRYFWVRVRV